MRPIPPPPLLLLAAVAAAFWPALGADYVYDDQILIAHHGALLRDDLVTLLTQPYLGREPGYWRPLTSLLLWAGHRLAGPVGVHLLQVVLHAATTLVVLGLGRRLLAAPAGAFAAALLFAVHPVQVEPVAWASALGDVLALLPLAVALRLLLRHRVGPASWRPFAAAGLLLAALLAKESALAMAPVLLGVAWRRVAGANGRRGPVLLLGGAVLLWWALRALVFGDLLAGIGQGVAVTSWSAARACTAPLELYGRQLLLLPWPWPLSSFRALAAAPSVGDLLQAGLGLALAAVLLVLAWRRRVARLPTLLLLLPPLLVAASVHHLGAYPLADRYLHPAVLGGALLLAARAPRATVGLALLLLPCTCAHTFAFREQAAFVQRALATAPADANVQVMAGNHELAAAQAGSVAALTLARERFATALRSLPADGVGPGGTRHRAFGEALLGQAWCGFVACRGRPDETVLAAFRRAVAADEAAPAAWVGLGAACGAAGRVADAEAALQRALALAPQSSTAHYNLGWLYLQNGQAGDARFCFVAALHWDPNNVAARQQLERMR